MRGRGVIVESIVKLRASRENVKVQLSEHNDLIQDNVIDKWQGILDLSSKLFDVPAALIMRLHHSEIEVFLKSNNKENPYGVHEKCTLGMGLYCETVIGEQKKLHIPNSLDHDIWRDNPDVELNMIHYLGLPLNWPNGDVFGTICILDNKTKYYVQNQIQLFEALKDTVEKDLSLIDKHIELKDTYEEITKTHHLIIEHEKNHLTNQLVSNITHEISTPIGVALTTASYLDFVVNKSKVISIHKLQEGASMVQKNLEQASRMLKSFKKLSHKENNIEEINLRYYISSLVQSMTYDLEKYKVDIKLEVDNNVVLTIDTGYLSQILINLILNSAYHAFKDAESRVIVIIATVDQNKLFLTVEDNGIGMNEHQLSTIYEAFVRYDLETEGSGLGLTIIKDIIIEKLKGTIACISEVDNGTAFNIEIPLGGV
jgi:signal transduction histidine kinase